LQTDRTIPNNKPDIIIRDKDKGTRMLINVAISEGKNVIKKKTKKILRYENLIIQTQRTWNLECKNKSDTSNMKGKWNYLKIIQTIREQRTGIA
jgi:hypothetical protein